MIQRNDYHMKFSDNVSIVLESGRGGNGCCSFKREKFLPKGGPDGGNGGSGGSVFILADKNTGDLSHLHYNKHLKADNGFIGRKNKCSSANGKNLYIKVPIGTSIYDKNQGRKIQVMDVNNKVLEIVKGGKAGFGNFVFKSSTNRFPNKYTLGKSGQKVSIRLDFFYACDVGLLGRPNSGRSSFLKIVSSSKPLITSYPFATKSPDLGLMATECFDFLKLLDTPSLIKGSSAGKGLGNAFLKHLSQAKLIIHVVDMSPEDSSDPFVNYCDVEDELQIYNEEIYSKKRMVLFNKVDLIPKEMRNDTCNKIMEKISLNKKIKPLFHMFSSKEKNLPVDEIRLYISKICKETLLKI